MRPLLPRVDAVRLGLFDKARGGDSLGFNDWTDVIIGCLSDSIVDPLVLGLLVVV